MRSRDSRPRIVNGKTAGGEEPTDSTRGRSADHEEKASPWKLGGLSIGELSKRVWNSVLSDDVFGRSAQLAYYFFLALFPALIFVTALLGVLAASGSRIHDSLSTTWQRPCLPRPMTWCTGPLSKLRQPAAAAS